MVDGGAEQRCDTVNANPVFCVLIISGGGGFGAYGAWHLISLHWSGNESRETLAALASTMDRQKDPI